MATTYTQASRPLRVTTALGADAVLLTAFRGREALSHLYQFELELMAPREKPVDFSKVLGQPALVELEMEDKKKRYFHGLVNRLAQGRRDEVFVYYRATVVPQFWLWTKREQSRIFQQITVPDILKKVLDGLKVTWEIKGAFQPRDYCVQYRESDFAFASRLMEEEGIYYFFKHTQGGHEMVVANTPPSHPDLPISSKLIYEEIFGGNRPEYRITEWERAQELRSGKVTLWDHCFELPHKKLDADQKIPDSVTAGTVTHRLALNGVDKLELYDFPGGYAQRFDGVPPGGGDRAGDLAHIFEDNKRTVGIRLQQEAVEAVTARGESTVPQMTAGHKFTLQRHYDADGDYVVTAVDHHASLGTNYRSGAGETLVYQNQFACIPYAVPYRPPQQTPRPTVRGSQTAVVAGPAGEEIFTDKYGRIKVQFHWDREGKNNEDSSCWLRVATVWAGKQWGAIHIPRIGQEVVVDFLEGDPDQPIVVGSVYNADQMPPWALPANKTQSGIQTRSSKGGAGANYNQIRFEDKKGAEQLQIHAEKDQDIGVEHDEAHWVGHDRKKTIDHDETTHVKHDRTETVDNNETITVHGNRTETVNKNETITVDQNRTRAVGGNESVTVTMMRTHTVGINEAITVGAAREVTVGAFQAISVGAYQAISVGAYQSITVAGYQTVSVGARNTITVGGAQTETVGGNYGLTIGGGHNVSVGKDEGLKITGKRSADVGQEDALKVGTKFTVEAGEEISFVTGDASIVLKKDGSITLKGKDITLTGSGKITAKADGDVVLKGSNVKAN